MDVAYVIMHISEQDAAVSVILSLIIDAFMPLIQDSRLYMLGLGT